MKRLLMLGFLCTLVLAAACGPQQGDETAQMPEETGKATLENGSFDFEVDGRTIHYEVYGTGPACIVLTNSWGFDSKGVRDVFNSLENIMTMVYFDPRGIGGSSEVTMPTDMSMAAVREDAHAILGELGLENAMFAGWSNGASNLLAYAAEYPEDVKGAIVLHGSAYVDPAFFQEVAQKYPEMMQGSQQLMAELQASDSTPEEKAERLKEFNVGIAFPMMTADPDTMKEMLPNVFANAQFSWDHNGYAMQEVFAFDAREGLANITAPVLIIAGTHDMMPVDMLKELADAIPNATFVIFENSGHFSSLEEPEKFHQTVSDFLSSIE